MQTPDIISVEDTDNEAGSSRKPVQDNPIRGPEHILYPTASDWLQRCATRKDRNQDGHDYLSLAPVFLKHEFARLDDVATLKASDLIQICDECNVAISKGLANRIVAYSAADVHEIKGKGVSAE